MSVVRTKVVRETTRSRLAFAFGLVVAAILGYVLTICFLIIFEMLSIAQRSYLFTPPQHSSAKPVRRGSVVDYVLPFVLSAPILRVPDKIGSEGDGVSRERKARSGRP